MAEATQSKSRFHVRRGGAAEIKKIEDPAEFAIAAADYLGAQPILIPQGFTPSQDLLCGMKIEAWSRAKALPLMKIDGRFAIAFSDPFDLPTQEEVSRWTHGKIWTLVAPAPELNDALQRLKSQEDASNPALAMENIMKGDEGDIEMTAGRGTGHPHGQHDHDRGTQDKSV